MNSRRGFTIVELIITISILVILIGLAVVNISASQAKSRDAQRVTQVNDIARALENFYQTGTSSSYDSGYMNRRGTYPAIDDIITTSGTKATYFKAFFPDLPDSDFVAPGASGFSLVAATNSCQTTTGITPQPTSTTYVYQPISVDSWTIPNGVSDPNYASETTCGSTSASNNTSTGGNCNGLSPSSYGSDTSSVGCHLCYDNYYDCIKFNLYYYSETAKAVEEVKSVNR